MTRNESTPTCYPELRGKIALVTGGSSGIGLATAAAFAHEGAIVVVASRNERSARTVLKTIANSDAVSWIACDVSSGTAVEKLIDTIRRRHGRLDYAFNNGGSGGKSAPVASTTEDSWRKTIDGYLTSVFLCMRHEIPLMMESGGGVIVNNSSVDGLRGYPFPGGAAYSAAKHGVLGLTRSAALEHAVSGPRITAICPGWVDTPPVAAYMRRGDSTAAEIIRQTPRGKIASPREIADSVLWLCSDAASFMIGSPLVIDGGYMA
ncbi:MAG: SDR family oxidoreductase [Proteobacteria bacterium]|nr:SDR family oxidoreductase [Pseudomonadota bacterium]